MHMIHGIFPKHKDGTGKNGYGMSWFVTFHPQILLQNVVQPVALQMTQQLFATVNPLNSGPTAGGLLPIWVIPMFAYLMVVALDGKTKNAPQQIKYQKLHLLIICPILELIIVCEHAEMKS